ncbi:helix-turn-helix transcriptional regulator [Carnobacteriaceae bacterium zg-ZUI252]|nr:helix-turn-helix transcriptional regulator [Carnobacteriaceae bacterium zg-ZUI252]MBS4770245.1 helix-turn-helix transcriptional regulator [Carnobacteriaceae bacterium zg-ZUI240]
MIQLPKMINYFRKQHDMTLEQLGEHFGKSKSAMSRWIKGDRSPMVDDLIRLADIFHTDVTTLLFGLDYKTVKTTGQIDSQTKELIQTIKQLQPNEKKETIVFAKSFIEKRSVAKRHLFPIQVVEAVAAGVGYSYDNNQTTTFYTDRDNLKTYDVATLVSGDSMEPEIKNGDVILLQKNVHHISGQIYTVDYNEKSYVKKVYFEKDNLRLVSLNDKYEDIIIPLNTPHYLNIVGQVVDHFTPINH